MIEEARIHHAENVRLMGEEYAFRAYPAIVLQYEARLAEMEKQANDERIRR